MSLQVYPQIITTDSKDAKVAMFNNYVETLLHSSWEHAT